MFLQKQKNFLTKYYYKKGKRASLAPNGLFPALSSLLVRQRLLVTQRLGFGPKLFKLVKLPPLAAEDMDGNVPRVDQTPVGAVLPFDLNRQGALPTVADG